MSLEKVDGKQFDIDMKELKEMSSIINFGEISNKVTKFCGSDSDDKKESKGVPMIQYKGAGYETLKKFIENPKQTNTLDFTNDKDITNIDNNSIKSILEELKNQEMTDIKEIKIQGTKITSLPAEIGNFTKLEKLQLYGNEITTLPTEIGKLKQLKFLDLSRNKGPEGGPIERGKLSDLPETLGDLTSLEEIRLVGNKIKKLPESFGNLTQLKQVSLLYNDLETLPDNFGNLKNLQELDLSNNQLKTLPESMNNLHTKTINLNYNQLTALPDGIGNGELKDYLTHLIVGGNKLITLPTSIGNFSKLSELNVSYNEISSLPVEIINLHKNLNYLFLDEDKITKENNPIYKDFLEKREKYIEANSYTSVEDYKRRNPPKFTTITNDPQHKQ